MHIYVRVCKNIRVFFPFLAAVLQMSGTWCLLAPVVQDRRWPGLEAGCGAGASGQKSTLNVERIGHLSWYPGKALGIVFSDAAKFLQQTFSWGFWARNAAGLHAPPLSMPFIFHPCPIASSQPLSKSFN